jgi:hypothetical protein
VAAARAGLVSRATVGPSQESPYLFGLPSPGSAALDYGAFILPGDGADGLERLGVGALTTGVRRAGDVDILSLLGFPDFLREGRARAARRAADGLDSGLPNAQRVLGQQATLTDDGGGLTFGQLPLLALALVLFSSLLLLGAVVPPGVIASSRLSPTSYARVRQPLALAAIGILVPVAIVALVVALS